MARIIVTFQDKVLHKYMVVPGSDMTIGRNPKCDIVIDNLAVSGQHAKIREDAGGVRITDLGSKNGTYVNDVQVTQQRLSHQDWVTIGNHVLIVDLYETLSLEATMQMLMAGSTSERETEQTIMYEMPPSRSSRKSAADCLAFISGGRGDYELYKSQVTIGKNKDADIVISGFWAFLAGQPAATISRRGNDYVLSYTGGLLKPKVNGLTLKEPTRLSRDDIIEIGPLQLQLKLS